MQVQATSAEHASARRDAGLSDVRRAQDVFTTVVANAGENSILGESDIHATLP